jgi:lysozyme family protein
MSQNNFDAFLKLVLQSEGGYSAESCDSDGTATDPKFIEKCAITTQMLVSLQA